MVKMTSSSNIASLKSSRGLTGLVNKHLNKDVRGKLKNVRSEFTNLNQHYMIWDENKVEEWREGLQDKLNLLERVNRLRTIFTEQNLLWFQS